MSGLCAAWKLRQAGLTRLRLLELGSQPGGTSVSGFGNGTRFPWGAHYINNPPREADCVVEVLRDLGVLGDDGVRGWPQIEPQHRLKWPRERTFTKDQTWREGLEAFPLAASADTQIMRQFEDDMLRWTLYRDSRGKRAFAMPLAYSSGDEEVRSLDHVSFAAYVRARGWQTEQLDWLLDYACRDDYGSSFDQVSAWAGIHYFACRYYDARVAEEYPADTLTWPEGNAFLTDGLAAALEPDQYLGRSLVLKIWQDGETVHTGFMDLEDGALRTVSSRTVIYAGKLHGAPFLVDGMPSDQYRAISSLVYSPWLVAAIFVRRLPAGTGAPIAWDNVMPNSPSTGYVVADHQRRPKPESPSVLVYYRPFVDRVDHARRELLEREHGYWVNQVMSDLTLAHPQLEDLVERIDFYRWGHGMVRPAPGVIWGVDSHLRRKPYGQLFFAGSDTTGLPLFEEACFAGIRSAEEAMSSMGVAHSTSLRGLGNV